MIDFHKNSEVCKMNDLICIGEAEVLIKEYNGQRVVTFKDIDTVHQRPSGTANKRFIDKTHLFTMQDKLRLSGHGL